MIKLCSKSDCTGCAACVNICSQRAISFILDHELFEQPVINHGLCRECHQCEQACPVINDIPQNSIPKVYAGFAKDTRIRTESSSGGLFSVFANDFIKNNGVVFGAAFDQNLHVRHISAMSEDELIPLRGSKYVQSDIAFSFRETKKYLQEKRPVFFTGTPCQIAGLYGFLGGKHENLFTCDLVCHGVPSPLFFKNYLLDIQRQKNITIDHVCFRKMDGWYVEMSFTRQKDIICPDFDMNYYLHAFLKSYSCRQSCYQCKFAKVPRVADISIADFWGIERDDDFRDNASKGVSLLLINNQKGQILFEKCQSELFYKIKSIDEALIENHNISNPSKKPVERDSFYTDYQTMSKQVFLKKYNLSLSSVVRAKIKIKKAFSLTR